MRGLRPLRGLPALLLLFGAIAALLAPSAAAQPCTEDVIEIVVEVGPDSMSFLLQGELLSGQDAEDERNFMDEDTDGTVSEAELAAFEAETRSQYNMLLAVFGDKPQGITLDGEPAKGWWVAALVHYNATGPADDRPLERDTLLELNFTGRGSQAAGAIPGDHQAVFGEDFEAFCPIAFEVARIGAAPGWFILTDSVEPPAKLDWFLGEGFMVTYGEHDELVSEESPLTFTLREEAPEKKSAKKKSPGLELPLVALGLAAAAMIAARRRN